MSDHDDTDRAYDVAEDLRSHIRTLESERDQARADARVLAAEVRAWRNAEHLRINEPHNEFRTRADARADTDASGALERNKP